MSMVLISSVPPAGAASGPLPNTVPQATVQAAGAAGVGPTAQQLLQTAVIASAMVPPYAPEQPKQLKPTLRTPPQAQPSSALAAQLLAQTPELSEEALAVFTPRLLAAQPEGAEVDAVNAWQAPPAEVAAEEVPVPVAAALPKPSNTNGQAITLSLQQAALPTAHTGDADVRNVREKPILLQQGIGGKKPGIAQARGSSAYALTLERNATLPNHARVEAVS